MTKSAKYLRLCNTFDSADGPKTETWQEHLDHYHGGKEPKGDCEWIDNDKGDSSLPGSTTYGIMSEARRIAKEICDDGRWIHQRVPKEALPGVQKGGRRLAEATYVARRNEGPSGSDSPIVPSKETQRRQIEDLTYYAKSEGIWIENADDVLAARHGDRKEGGESYVYFVKGDDGKNESVIKLITPWHFNEPVVNFDRIALFNWMFPSNAMKVIGFGHTRVGMNTEGNGDFVTIVRQPFVRAARPATLDELAEYMNGIGFHTDMDEARQAYEDDDEQSVEWYNEDKSICATDLHRENVFVTPERNLSVIDADIRLNTPNLKMGGKYTIPMFNP